MSVEDSLPENLYIGRIRVREGDNSETGYPWNAYAGYNGISSPGLFVNQVLGRPETEKEDLMTDVFKEWAYGVIYVLPVEGEV